MSDPQGLAVSALVELSRTVTDLGRTEAFYRDGLGFESVGTPEPIPAAIREALGLPGASGRRLRMRLGRQSIAFLAFDESGLPYPAAAATDPWFQHAAIVVRDMGEAYTRLVALKPEPISRGGPQHLPPDSGGVAAYKFRDPDGHPLELIAFPAGPSAEIWKDAPGLFLGIDHSAITVTDLDLGLGFFRDGLGLAVASHGLNHGPEQAALDGVEVPLVDVIGLMPRGVATPHVELLHYRAPKRAAIDSPRFTVCDRATTRFVFAVPDLDGIMAHLHAAHPGLSSHRSADRRVAGLVGPDGHGLILIEATFETP